MSDKKIDQFYMNHPENAEKSRLKDYFNWLEFGNPAAPYSKHTIKAYKGEILLFLGYCFDNGVETLNEIGNPLIRQYLASYAKKSVKPSTISHKVSCIDSYFEWLYLEDFLPINPITKYKQTIRRGGRGGRKEITIPTFLYPNEVQSLFLYLNKYSSPKAIKNRAIIGLLLDTGLRASEMCKITVQDAKNLIQTGHIKIMGKGGKERVIHARGQYFDVLQDYLDILDPAVKTKHPLFVTTMGNPIKQENLFSLISRLLNKLGIQKGQTGPHLLRHTAATMMLQEGRNIKDVQQSLGHSSIQTTSLYTHYLSAEKE
ncbi:MAG: tyrosine-type recombinase/integrase [Methyloprofundus sp.]|nr:tyrosine-type recombinase/integrase [Methyloprofundus sp.]